MRRALQILTLAALALGVVPGPWSTGVAEAQLTLNFTNGSASTLASGISAGASSLTVATGEGAKFPATPFTVIIYNSTDYPAGHDDPDFEEVLVTNVAGDVFTLSPVTVNAHNTGGKTYAVVSGITAFTMGEISTQLAAVAPSATPTWAGANLTAALTLASTASPGFNFVGDSGNASIYHDGYGTSNLGVYRYRKARGSLAAPRRANTNDNLGNIQWQGGAAADDSTDSTFAGTSASMRVMANENFTTSARGARFEFQTTATGTTTGAVRLTIDEDAITLGSGVGLFGTSSLGVGVGTTPTMTLTGTDVTLASGVQILGTTGALQMWPEGYSTGGTIQIQVENNPIEPGGGSEKHETDLYLYGRADSVTNYYTGAITFGATDGSSVGSGTSMLSEGNWTSGGGFTLRRFAIYEHSIDSELLMYQSSSPGYVNIGRTTSAKGLGMLLTGQDINAQATGETAALNAQGDFISNDANTRTYYGSRGYYTLNTGGSNTNKTIHFDDVDTVNTAVTGISTTASTLFRRSYGGSVKASVDVNGNTAFAGSFTLSGDDQPAQITAATNDYAISDTSAVTVVDADQIRALTGMTGGSDGRQHTLINDGAAEAILILRQEDTGSSAGNRFAMAADVVLEPNRSATFWYDSTASRWRLISTTAPAGAMRDYLPFEYNELLGTAGADTKEATEAWNYAVISSGTQTKIAATDGHRGVLRTSSSTTANSGGYLQTDVTAFLLGGGEFSEHIFNIDTLTNLTFRLGFLDTAVGTADAVDGAYIEVPSTGAAVCKTANNSTRTTSSTIATLSTGTWYRARIQVDNTAANVTCEIFDANGASLGSQTNSANIPTGAGRVTGHGYIATNSGTTATSLVQMDYLAVGTKRAVIR